MLGKGIFKVISTVHLIGIGILAFAADPFEKTPEQHAYLAGRGPITVCVDPDFMPYEKINSNDEHVGIAADYFKMFSQMIEKPIQRVPTTNWVKSEEYAKQRKCDVLSLLNDSPARRQYLNFTSPYIEASVVLIARQNEAFIDGLDQLAGKTLAMVKGYIYEDLVKHYYPSINLVYVNSMDEAFASVSAGQVFSTIGSLYVATSRIQELGLSNLKVAGTTEFKNELRVGVRNDDPLLLTLFETAIKRMDPIEENQILRQWISVRIETGTDYRLLFQVMAVVLIVVALLIYRQWSVHKLLRQLNHANEQLKIKSEALNHLSRTDSLTKLHNRLYLDEHLATEQQRLERYETPFCCILMDVDKFKEVNDIYGHSVGDTILQEVASVMRSSVRFNDIVGRWGGEEFIILCPQTKLDGALILAETLRSKIEQYNFTSVPKLTCSFGVAQGKKDQTDIQLINNADEALYRAKAQGRNQVCSALE